jgi:hypothetical protein
MFLVSINHKIKEWNENDFKFIVALLIMFLMLLIREEVEEEVEEEDQKNI